MLIVNFKINLYIHLNKNKLTSQLAGGCLAEESSQPYGRASSLPSPHTYRESYLSLHAAMDAEIPSYMSPTRSSLGRMKKANGKSPSKEPTTESRLERQRKVIRLRMASLEQLQSLIAPSEKWPRTVSVRVYREIWPKITTLTEAASSTNIPRQPSMQARGSSSRIGRNSPTSVGNSKSGSSWIVDYPKELFPPFPFPIRTRNDLSAFPQFPILPAELRLQIWEQAILVPKFIEVQFYTGSIHPRFVNGRQYEPLLSVCRESRAVAKALSPNPGCLHHVRPVARVWG